MDPISTALAAAAMKATAGPAAKLAKAIGIDAYNILTSTFEKCFQGHLEDTLKRCSKMKNILYRDQSVDFETQYINVSFSALDKPVSDKLTLSKIISGERILICGTAGAGKTMFMRWSALELIRRVKQHGRIPLYLEMRYFDNNFEKEPLENFIYSKTSSEVDSSNFSQFKNGLKSGIFIIILDAIDEIKPDLRDKVVSKILDFLREYPVCGIAVSSRSDEKLESIQEFIVLRTTPMTKDQIISVINNLDYDKEVKSKLILRLNEGLYNDLKEFLSNPLLATIMLLTFDHSADIPTKLTSFYQQAFEALYQRHDAAKGAYKRDHYASLPIDRFQAVFSTFSFQTYLNYKFEFSDGDLLEAFRSACEYNQEKTSPQLIIKDSMESVCLIQRDGLDNIFSHRSFQEYFCALFVSKYREADVGKLIEAIASMENRSNVLRMLYELSPEVFEYEWVLPILNKFLSKFQSAKLNKEHGLRSIFSATFDSINVGLETNRVVAVAWPAGQSASKAPAVKWMSIIRSSTHGKNAFYNGFFVEQLWESLTSLLHSLPPEKRPERDLLSSSIKKYTGNSSKESIIRLDPSDADWLIYSNLPHLFRNLISEMKCYRDEIMARRSRRQMSVENLLSKPKRVVSG